MYIFVDTKRWRVKTFRINVPFISIISRIIGKQWKKREQPLRRVCIQSECGKKRPRKSQNTDTSHAVNSKKLIVGSGFNYETCLDKIPNLEISLEEPNFQQIYKSFVLKLESTVEIFLDIFLRWLQKL